MTPTTPAGRLMTVNVNVLGVGQRPAAWRSPDIAPDAIVDRAHWEEVARIAERGLIDALFLADRPAITDPRSRPVQYLDPTVLVPAMAAVTDGLGFVATSSTTLNDPVELARRLWALHTATSGRFAWNAVTTWDVEAVRNFGVEELPERSVRYARAEEFVTVVRSLWDTAGTDAVVDHEGSISVHAGLGMDRLVDGRPAIVQAGGSEPGWRLAGLVADGVYSVDQDPVAAAAHRDTIRGYAVEAGRPADAVRVFPGLAIVIGSTEREAWERFDHWEHLAPARYSLNALANALGTDLVDVDLDAPVPESVLRDAERRDAGWSAAYRRVLIERIRTEQPSVRRLLRDFGGYGQRFLAGTPEQIADSMESWFRSGAADGFNIMLDLFPSGLSDFVDHVVPELQRRGLFRREYGARSVLERFAGE
ncbi:NtaA/DmoA family FMN-dependent monooxygenase [Mycetocola reblochoni]|uniref:Nitrilotriacetate monooxygenase component A n=2 Tax=Mycetocola reblochoni TaxID=331618 RepID=A0A1R4IXF8_9MICO|nr:NtaA/DmoA family FMN-dependent monooxygenase [Mycetocola reblochoni]RLP70915.1 LLM class flavin-dependent oxidoreductase [Mycetocola reblochoni]SJN24552.1 Nitrilotriacetate monooxygenase component A [Mycetocola reblochoni REB411]